MWVGFGRKGGPRKPVSPPGVVFEYARREAFRARRRSSTSRLRPVFSRVRRREGRPPFVGLEEKDAYVRSPLASGRIRETHLVEVFCSRTGSRRVERHESGARTCVVRRGTASEASDDRRTQTGRMRRTNIWNETRPCPSNITQHNSSYVEYWKKVNKDGFPSFNFTAFRTSGLQARSAPSSVSSSARTQDARASPAPRRVRRRYRRQRPS